MPPDPGQPDTRPRHARPGDGKKVVVAMSGGVDSSAAAKLLLDEGYDLVGVFMRNGAVAPPEEETCDLTPAPERSEGRDAPRPRKHKQGCCSVNDAHDARLVAATLGIPFYVLNLQKDFGRIMDYFVAEYNAGRTPNPCVRCNDWLKFGRLHDYARSIDADFVASGHYARILRPTPASERSEGRDFPRLLRGVDRNKDQSYVLFGARRETLAHMLLPIGGYDKPTIRQIARDAGLETYNKPDSQEICFVPDNDYAGMVERNTEGGFAPGDILDEQGEVIGEHAGHQHFTLGQRRGIGVALGYPIYVVHKDPQANTVTVGGKQSLMSGGCTADDTNWLIDPPADDGWTDCLAKVRYNSDPVAAKVRAIAPGDAALAAPFEVRFDAPVEAVTPGQAVVCYGRDDSDLAHAVLCGGWIDATLDPADG